MMLSILLQATQVVDTVNSAVSSIPVVAKPTEMSLWDVVLKGGPIMIPIGILFAVAIFIFIERYITVRNASASEGDFMNNIKDFIESDKIDNALSLCKKNNLPFARKNKKGIKRIGRPIKEIEESIEIVGKFEVYELEKGLPILAVIAGIASFLGLRRTLWAAL